jgi:hypothetical protein
MGEKAMPSLEEHHERWFPQLGEAIKRGVNVLVTVPRRKGDWREQYELQPRSRARRYFDDCSNDPSASHFCGGFMCKGKMGSIIHSFRFRWIMNRIIGPNGGPMKSQGESDDRG